MLDMAGQRGAQVALLLAALAVRLPHTLSGVGFCRLPGEPIWAIRRLVKYRSKQNRRLLECWLRQGRPAFWATSEAVARRGRLQSKLL